MSQNLLAAFVSHAESRPYQTAAFVLRETEIVAITWRQLAETVTEVSNRISALRADSTSTEPRIVYRSDNGLSDIVLPLACHVAGLIEVPIDHRLGESSIHELRLRSGGIWLDSDQHKRMVWESLDRNLQRADTEAPLSTLPVAAARDNADQPALILWTSGTTGEPKGVVLTHQNLVGNAAAKLAAVPQAREDVRLTTLPLCHAYARTCDFGTWLLSGCQLAVASGFDGWRSLASHVHPTLANTVPSLAKRLLDCVDKSLGMDRLRLLGCGGAAMRESDFVRWQERGVTVIQGYGLTEAGPVICSATPQNAAPGMVGMFVDGWESDIRDGRLFVRGPHTMLEYLDDPAATSARIDPDGWLDTSDIIEVDQASKQYRVVGRADDTIVLDNGHKIHPVQIERRIEQLAGVRYAMLVGSGRSTTLWIDSENDDQEFMKNRVLTLMKDDPPWQIPGEVKYFDAPLSIERGEITQKGSICRSAIRQRLSMVGP